MILIAMHSVSAHGLHITIHCVLCVGNARGVLRVHFSELVVAEVCPAYPALREVFGEGETCRQSEIRFVFVAYVSY